MPGIETLTSLFLITAGFGIISVVAGFVMRKFPPKKINSFYGYRTSSSMRDQERWDSAQTYSAREFIKIGFLNLLISVLSLLFYITEPISTILGLTFVILSVIIFITRVELTIKNRFRK